MARTKEDDNELGQRISAGIAEGLAQVMPARKISVGQYLKQDNRNHRHPSVKNAVKFTRDYYQNGTKLDWTVITDEECRLLEQITVPGHYIDDGQGGTVVDVSIGARGGGDVAVNIMYNNARVDQRMELKDHFRHLKELASVIVAEQNQRLGISV